MSKTGYTYEQVKEIAEAKGMKLISTSYKNCHGVLDYYCPKHDYNFSKPFSNFKNSIYGCPKCADEAHYDKCRIGIDEARRRVKSAGYKLLEDTYIDNETPMRMWCPKHGEFTSNIASITAGKRCWQCGRESATEKQRVPYEKIEKFFASCGLTLVKQEYRAVYQPLHCICPIHGDVTITYHNLQNTKQCPECGKHIVHADKIRGENSSNWAGGITSLNMSLRYAIIGWSKEQYKRVGYRCEITGKRGKLNVHHMFPFSKIVKITMDELGLEIKQDLGDYSLDEWQSIVDKFKENNAKLARPIVMLDSIHYRFHQFCGGNLKPTSYEQLEQFRKMLREEQEKKAG